MGVTVMAGLMAHQREGVEFLLAKGSGLLAFEQGLGKTLVAIEAYRRLRAGGTADALLVGTPATNTPADVYPQLAIVAGCQPFGSFAAFDAVYGGRDTTPAQRQALAAKIAPYLMRRTKEECLDFPDYTLMDVLVELPA